MSTPLQPYEVYAIRYAHNPRRASQNFIGGDPHDGPMPHEYYVWLIRGNGRNWLVDTGFDAAMASKRDRPRLRCPSEGLALLGVSAADIHDVIITHMHYDHAGNEDLFRGATYHLQDLEMSYVTGRHMCHHALAHPFECDDVVAMVRRLFRGTLQFHDKTEELAPGLSVHHIGGHTQGLQAVRVWTRRGWVVLASDAAHFYANLFEGRPFPILHSLADMMEGHRTLRKLASSDEHIIPGHDELVLKKYPAPRPELEGIVVRLDVDPKPGFDL